MSVLSHARRPRWRAAGYAGSAVIALAGIAAFGIAAGSATAAPRADNSSNTTTPIKHVVVIYDENISYDHYFGTYPHAVNATGETPFTAAAGTPTSNNYVAHPDLLGSNPNSVQPARLTPAQALTCSQNHDYVPEQKAFDGGAMDGFPENTQAKPTCAASNQYNASNMDYYDGNTVTGLWNYAQNYAMSDNSWGGVFGPSTPGALNLISGQTHGGLTVDPNSGATVTSGFQVSSPDPTTHVGTVNGDPDPYYDDCSDNSHTTTANLVKMSGQNIGDLLNAKGVTWGWFQGGFTPSTPWDGASGHYASCLGTTHANIGGGTSVDYSPHHSPVGYYSLTSHPHHLAPASPAEVGHDGQANHNYDLTAFNAALTAGNVPAVSFLKAAEYQDGHAGYSDPIDEQHFLVNEINAIQTSSIWPSTAIVIAYDDSDGWYDHAFNGITNGSDDPAVQSGDQPFCTAQTTIVGGYQDRCGPGPRLPLMVVSPFTAPNTIDHTPTEQSSITKFIETNWSTGPIGDSSLDARAGSMNGLFTFSTPQNRTVLLNPDGTVKSIDPITSTAAATRPTLPDTGVDPTWGFVGAGLLLVAGGVFWFTRRRVRA